MPTEILYGRAAQRKVFTTPVRNEADDVSVTKIVPSVRGLNRNRGCAAVSIGEKCYESERDSWPDNSPSESGPCVKTMLCGNAVSISNGSDNAQHIFRCSPTVDFANVVTDQESVITNFLDDV